jgi:dUTP pyrophosphatase
MTEPRFPRAVTLETELAADIMCAASSKYTLTMKQAITLVAHYVCNAVHKGTAALPIVAKVIDDPMLTSEQQIDVSHVLRSAVMGMATNVRARIELELIHRELDVVVDMLLADLPLPFQVLTTDGVPLSERLSRATDGSAAYDILAPHDILVTREAQFIGLGFKSRMDYRQAALLLPRSGFGVKWGFALVNTVGLIDSDYPDEWMAKIYLNEIEGVPFPEDGGLKIPKGERLAQFVLARVEHPEMVQVTDESELRATGRVGGFGSSNIHK